MHKNTIFILFWISIVSNPLLSGCASGGYGSRNNIEHMYTTNTQQSGHELSGVEVKFEGTAHNSVVGVVGQVVSMTKLDVTYYINREEVDTFNAASSDYSTFIKLPPGDHEFAYKVNMQGFMTLGVPTDKTFYVYKFTVSEGEVSEITLHPKFRDKEERELEIDFDNVSKYWLEGKCYNDYHGCNPA